MENKIYSKLYDLFYSKKNYEREFIFLKNIIEKRNKKRNKILLELGCGTGNFLEHFSKIYFCTGIDNSIDMLNIAKKKLDDNVILKKKDIRNFKFKKKFDVIICLFSTMNHLNKMDIKKCIFNSLHHLNEGGLFIIENFYEKDKIENDYHVQEINTKHIKGVRVINIEKNKNFSNFNSHFFLKINGKNEEFKEKIKLTYLEEEYVKKILYKHNVKLEVIIKKNNKNLFVIKKN